MKFFKQLTKEREKVASNYEKKQEMIEAQENTIARLVCPLCGNEDFLFICDPISRKYSVRNEDELFISTKTGVCKYCGSIQHFCDFSRLANSDVSQFE